MTANVLILSNSGSLFDPSVIGVVGTGTISNATLALSDITNATVMRQSRLLESNKV